MENFERDEKSLETIRCNCGGRNAASARTLGRLVAFAIVVIGALVIAAGLSACTDDDDDGPDTEWYISGVWQDNQSWDEDMVFYSDGTGYWESTSTGYYLDFDYYCFGNMIYFTFYPVEAPPYGLDCYIDFINDGNMSISWPADSFYGPVTVYYTRVD